MVGRVLPIEIPDEEIAEFCRRNHIRRLSFSGSVLRDDFGPESDIDVLVEFEEDHRPGLAFFGMGDELAEILRLRVDFLTESWIHERFLRRVREEAREIYVAA
jgi:uncharacterized protein